MGASLSRLQGTVDPSVPAYVDLSHKMAHDPWNIKGLGFLGMNHAPFRPDGESMQDITLRGISDERLGNRASLLSGLDRFRREAERKQAAGLYDDFTEQALGVLTSSRLVEAMDLDKDVTVLVWGEFGRTPKINERAGRDHWPGVHAALLAGGSMRTGQVIGSTNRLAEEAVDRPVHMQEVFATLYQNLGIKVASTTIPDNNGRPQYLVDRHEVINELV